MRQFKDVILWGFLRHGVPSGAQQVASCSGWWRQYSRV
ncbi:hypothetical protein UYSO10_3933 [Kosakonia radicincitans]|nr:hypothetical protein UYSO10_3933 [Kosakonia radicincitans]